MYLKQFFINGLGHASYLISSDSTKQAAVIDPARDIEMYVAEAQSLGLRIRYALETHNHNDFVSGAHQLARAVGAEHVASAEADLQFPYHAVRDGDVLSLGELRMSVLFTPGHTPEHVCYVVTDTSRAEAPVLIFTGGDLLVGTVGRPDLLGKELGEKLAPLLYDSLHGKILKLADYVEVLPTHGAGSLCGKGISGKRTSTIGYERRFNPALQKKTKREFVHYVLSGNPGIPTYYRRMRPLNQAGPPAWQIPEPRPLGPEEVAHLVGHGATVLDTRDNVAFGSGHIPGAINIGLDTMFVTWVGWLVPSDIPIVLIHDRSEDWDDIVTRLGRIGYEKFAGYLQFGMNSWIEAALPISQIPQWTVHELHARLSRESIQVLDVRMDSEWRAGHISGAVHIPLGELPERVGELDRDRLTAALCGTGYRSSIATSILKQRGFSNVVNVLGGMTAWLSAGYPTTRGQEVFDGHTTSEQLRVRDEGQFAIPGGD